MIKAVTYNIFIGRKLGKIVDWLITSHDQIDMCCFQEFPQDKIKEVVEKLKGHSMDYVFAEGITIQGNVYGELTLFNTKKLKLLRSERIHLGGKGDFLWFLFDRYGRLDFTFERNKLERSALLTQFVCDNKTVTLINTHLTSHHLNYKRLQQIKSILKNVSDGSTVVLGDFNYPFGKLVKFMKINGFSHATRRITTHRLLRIIPQHLDYIFYKGCQVENIKVHKVRYSDHFPIFFEIIV